MTLYTKKGDDGTTTLFGGEGRLSKSSDIAEALGTLDELNAVIGICRAKFKSESIAVDGKGVSDILYFVQQHLFIVQAELAGADKHIDQAKVDWAEHLTDTIESGLEPITSFLLPGASELSSILDLARTVARRAERRVVAVADASTTSINKETLAYMNRLSSLLYALVRLANDAAGAEESAPTYS